MSRTGSQLDDLPEDIPGYEIYSFDGEEGGHYGPMVEAEFLWRPEDFVSRPKFSKHCDLEENILEFDCSYGYDCKRPDNLTVLDERTAVFASGNLIHFLDLETKEVWYRRCARGAGIGHITKNPNRDYPHMAVAENGRDPLIFIYEWPSMEIMYVLRGGTTKRYSHLNYNPNGDLLASQGYEPDYMITIWNWPKSIILLRVKSYVNDVYKVMFSPEVPGHLTTCGVAHIKFWKMARTFTGLKLQGEVGRFGKTEYSDIFGIYPMADEKVVSGCYWGNILIWEEGAIKIEVCRKNRKRCHEAPITQFYYGDGELWSVGMDGHIKVWFYDTIDQADPPDDDRFVLMEPTYDYHTPGAEFMCIRKQFQYDPEDTFYIAQDGKGGIWRIDLNFEEEPRPPVRLLKSHAGSAMDMDVCPWGPYFCSLGNGGWLHCYQYVQRLLLLTHLFPAGGRKLIWVPLHVDRSGEVLIGGFTDGAVRVIVLKLDETKEPTQVTLHVIQVSKAHTQAITAMTINRKGTILVSCGEDSTMFLQHILSVVNKYMVLVPIGYIRTTDVVNCLTWHNTLDTTIILGCIHGQIMVVDLIDRPVNYTTITYILYLNVITQRFRTYKSQIKRDRELLEIAKQKAAKRERKRIELQLLREENPGLNIDSELFLADSVESESLGPVFMPKIPNKILFIQHTKDDTLWLSMAGYDAGYIYEYKIGQEDPVPYKCTMVHESDDNEILNYVYNKTREYLIFNMHDGSIRVNRVNKKNWRDLSNYWELTMHENFKGFITSFKFTFDESYLITSGIDGNIFSFRFYPEDASEAFVQPIRIIPDESVLHTVNDMNQTEILSMEETIVKAEVDRIERVANENKQDYLDELENLREHYERVLERNLALPKSQQITEEELLVDERVTEDMQNKLDADLALVKRKLEFDVEKARLRMAKLKAHFIDCLDVFSIEVSNVAGNNVVSTYKMRVLGEFFEEAMKEVERRIEEEEARGRPPKRLSIEKIRPPTPPRHKERLEYFLMGLPKDIIEHHLGSQINRLLAKYRARKAAREARARETLKMITKAFFSLQYNEQN